MKLPSEPAAEFQKLSTAPAQLVLRAVYAIDGHMGETYVVSNGEALFFFSKRLGANYEIVHFPFSEVRNLSVETDGVYAKLTLTSSAQSLQLTFTAWDRPALDKLVEDWQGAMGATGAEPATESSDGLTPLVAYCATHLAMMQIDGQIRVDEMASLVRTVKDPYAIDAGRKYLQAHGNDGLLSRLDALLDENQTLCLLANLTNLAMSDGLLRSKEQTFLQQLCQASGTDPAVFEKLVQHLMVKNNISVFRDTKAPASTAVGLTPLVAFCASLQAMIEVDGTVDREELSILSHAINNPLTIAQGIGYLKEHGIDALIGRLENLLDQNQRSCLLGNLIAVAMADGLLRGKEQELMDRFRVALGISEQDYESMFHTLMLKNCITLFTDPQ